MSRFLRYFTWVLGAAVIGSAPCSASHTCWTVLPLPASLDVGQRWTYLTISEQLDTGSEEVIDSSTDTLTISVVSSHLIKNRTYFLVNDNESGSGFYWVDSSSKVWKYDEEKETETLCWDLWRPLSYNFDSETMVFGGAFISSDIDFKRFGPYDLYKQEPFDIYPLPYLYPSNEYGFHNFNTWVKNLLFWEATPLYNFFIGAYESSYHLTIAPNVGVLFYYTGSWEFRLRYILLAYESDGSEHISTSVEDISFGELKNKNR